MNKHNFWVNTQGVFPITLEGEYNDLIVFAVNQYKESPEFEVNFNKTGDVFYIRTKDFAVRIANNWGEVGSCKWELERDHQEDKFQMVIISYGKLIHWK